MVIVAFHWDSLLVTAKKVGTVGSQKQSKDVKGLVWEPWGNGIRIVQPWTSQTSRQVTNHHQPPRNQLANIGQLKRPTNVTDLFDLQAKSSTTLSGGLRMRSGGLFQTDEQRKEEDEDHIALLHHLEEWNAGLRIGVGSPVGFIVVMVQWRLECDARMLDSCA